MTALAALFREFRIAYYERALKEMSPLHRDVPSVVLHLDRLRAQRPRVVPRVRSRCEEMPGMCAGDPACSDTRCPGRTFGLYQRDGGMSVSGALSFPIEHSEQS